ncbi:MAG: TonB C-terminal domain-containing protein [Acidobacteria bacterium]|nr:TonB C-terminal domain-containing protein [Acidobacteriota bacterium]
MTEVTDVIIARRARPERFSAMVVWSMAAHAFVIGFVLFGPIDWRLAADEPPRTVMMVSLAGAPGPRAGGMTPMGGRAVPTPPERPRAVAPPPPTPPESVPEPGPTRRPPPPRPAPTPEAEPQPGVTRTETGARGQGFGLSTGGAGGSGVQLDVTDFCCPEYLQQMVALIQQNWQSNQGIAGSTHMRFTILRSGLIQGVMTERSSGFLALDLAAEQALLRTRLPDLPPQFPHPTLTVNIEFVYQR